jgi:hypothetical protein
MGLHGLLQEHLYLFICKNRGRFITDSGAVSMETRGFHIRLLTQVDDPCSKSCHLKDKDVTEFTVLTEKVCYNGIRGLKDEGKVISP